MADVTDISQARFTEAKAGHERSKAAVLAENKMLHEKVDGISQLLAAVLMRFGEDSLHLHRVKELVFELPEIERWPAGMIAIEVADGQARLFLKRPR